MSLKRTCKDDGESKLTTSNVKKSKVYNLVCTLHVFFKNQFERNQRLYTWTLGFNYLTVETFR